MNNVFNVLNLLNDLLSMVLYDCWVIVTDCVSVDVIVIAGVDGLLVTYTVLYCKLLLVISELLIVILDDAAINILTIGIVYILWYLFLLYH